MVMTPKDFEKLGRMDEQIQRIKKAALELRKISEGVQALDCNAQRILASVAMLEINFSDIKEMVSTEGECTPPPKAVFS